MLKTNNQEHAQIEALQKLELTCLIAMPTGYGGDMELVAAYRDPGAALDAAMKISPEAGVFDVSAEVVADVEAEREAELEYQRLRAARIVAQGSLTPSACRR